MHGMVSPFEEAIGISLGDPSDHWFIHESTLAFGWEPAMLDLFEYLVRFGRSSVEFEKPPVVEAWIAFRFALTQESRVWDENAAKGFVERCFKDFSAESLFKFTQIEVDAKTGKPNLTGAQEFFDMIKAFSTDRERCVQARRDTLVFNQLNKGQWSGYPAMRDGAMEAARKYMEFRDLTELIGVVLHYRDVVAIPTSPGAGVRLEDWFRIHPEVPADDFGTVSAFSFSVHLPEMCKAATTAVKIRSLPPSSEGDSELKFSVDWHVTSIDRISDLTRAEQWLDSAHTALRSSFDMAFTPQCRRLFSPSRGD